MTLDNTAELSNEESGLSVKNLNMSFKTKKQQKAILKDLNFMIPEGKITAFLGPNGAGKTTTIKILLGLIKPSSGDIRYKGNKEYLKYTGAVLEGSRNIYWRLSAVENFEYFGALKGLNRKKSIDNGLYFLKLFDLYDKKDIDTRSLSRGQQQIVAICCALLNYPRILFLDEPTLGLDLKASEKIQLILKELSQKNKMGIFLTTHEIKIAQNISDYVIFLDKGSIIYKNKASQIEDKAERIEYLLDFKRPLSNSELKTIRSFGQLVVDENKKYLISLDHQVSFQTFLTAVSRLPICAMQQKSLDLESLFKRYIK
ncbi:ABC transporter ATP-binding protein [Oenococcus sp.]|uniref:ABC transporter ATP-binding protein n=1 Tax=Oenococcus sp. TaxID=1979414 RepID=UPI0039ED983F